MSRTVLAVIVTVGLAAPAAAQPSLSASVGPDLSAITGSGDTSRQLTASMSLEHAARSERVRLFYDFDTGDYATPGSWRFQEHHAGASYRVGLGKKGANRLYVGGDATLRRNGGSWGSADYNAVGSFANLELHPGPATVRTGYRLDVRRFVEAPAFDQRQHTVFGSALVSFETRTTLIGEVTAGAKHYEGVSAHTEVAVVNTGGAGQPHGVGIGRGAGMANLTLVPTVVAGEPGSDARQVTIFARIAQSLAARTGLSLEASRRQVGGDVPPSLVATPATFFDDGIYDDMFASHATRGVLRVKSIVGPGVEIEASATALDKDYPSTFAFDDQGAALPGVLRSDRVRQARVGVAWPLLPSRTGSVALDLLTGYDYTKHESTSALYRYRAHTIRFAVGVSY